VGIRVRGSGLSQSADLRLTMLNLFGILEAGWVKIMLSSADPMLLLTCISGSYNLF
jgi:hypothetical protein